MFLNLRPLQRLNVKIAPSAKLPYIADNITLDKNSYKAYREVYNTMYCLKSGPYKTCFYLKNSEINYYRKWVYGDELFILDIISENYKPIKFKNLRIGINDENSTLIKTGRGKWYVITRDEILGNLLILDALSGTHFYEEKIKDENNLYLDVLYPIANKVLPIIHVNRWNLCFKLFDTDNEKLYTIMEIKLKDINRIVKLILEEAEDAYEVKDKLSHYEMDYVREFNMKKIEYLYDLYDKKFIYVKGVRLAFSLTARYKSKEDPYNSIECNLGEFLWRMELDREHVKCYLELSQVKLYHRGYFKSKRPLKPIIRRYSISDGLSDIYLSQCLYKDQCYYIYNTFSGVGIIQVSESNYVELSSDQASLYRFENYLILLFYRKFFIIDTKNKRAGYWSCENCKVFYQIKYKMYYSETKNKLIFLSDDLKEIITIDIDRLNFIFNSNKKSDCTEIVGHEDNAEGSLCDAIYCLRLDQAIAELIALKQGIAIDLTTIQLVSHYIDTISGTLYLSATYVIEKVRYMGIFSLRILYGKIGFKMLHHGPISMSYNGMASNIDYKLGLSKIFLYRLDVNVLVNLDITYDRNKNYLVSIRYNRNSIAIKTNRYPVVAQTAISSKDLITVTYFLYYHRMEDSVLLFITSGLHLVKPMTPIQL